MTFWQTQARELKWVPWCLSFSLFLVLFSLLDFSIRFLFGFLASSEDSCCLQCRSREENPRFFWLHLEVQVQECGVGKGIVGVWDAAVLDPLLRVIRRVL